MPRIILVDDEQWALMSLKKFITAVHPDFTICGTFSNGVTALEYLLHNPVDIVITDIVMPQMNGIMLSKEIRQRIPDCLVILISGCHEFEYARSAIKYNVVDYLLKPIDFRELSICLTHAAQKLNSTGAEFSSNGQESPTDSTTPAQIQKSIDYIRKNYHEQISREELAAFCHMSPSYFSEQFRRHVGVGFIEYLTKVRIDRAIELLQKDLRIEVIANMVGYRHRNRFISNFRVVTGYTPTEYRKNILYKENIEND